MKAPCKLKTRLKAIMSTQINQERVKGGWVKMLANTITISAMTTTLMHNIGFRLFRTTQIHATSTVFPSIRWKLCHAFTIILNFSSR